jgi:hypothetical protein
MQLNAGLMRKIPITTSVLLQDGSAVTYRLEARVFGWILTSTPTIKFLTTMIPDW